MPDDYYVSQYSGEEIDERLTAAHNAVRYDAAQTLTDAQKAQARNNISAMQGIESTDHPGCCYVLNGSTVEWVNPPMMLGIELITRLEFIHHRNFIHRDIKPDNFVVGIGDRANVIYILDFGLSKQYREPHNHRHIPYFYLFHILF